MNATQKARLLKLAAFLIALPKQKFNFAVVATLGEKPMLEALAAKKESCGTVACAMGWTPALFPRLIAWTDEMVAWDGTKHLDVCSRETGAERDAAMREIFGLSQDQVDFLFYPDTNGNGLEDGASAKAVGRHIIRFVKWNEKRVAKLKKLEREKATLEARIEAAQERVDEIDSLLYDANNYGNDYPDRG